MSGGVQRRGSTTTRVSIPGRPPERGARMRRRHGAAATAAPQPPQRRSHRRRVGVLLSPSPRRGRRSVSAVCVAPCALRLRRVSSFSAVRRRRCRRAWCGVVRVVVCVPRASLRGVTAGGQTTTSTEADAPHSAALICSALSASALLCLCGLLCSLCASARSTPGPPSARSKQATAHSTRRERTATTRNGDACERLAKARTAPPS